MPSTLSVYRSPNVCETAARNGCSIFCEWNKKEKIYGSRLVHIVHWKHVEFMKIKKSLSFAWVFCVYSHVFILCRSAGRRIGIVSLLTKHLNWLPVVYLGFNLLSWHSRREICSNFRLASWKVLTNMGQCLFNDFHSLALNVELLNSENLFNENHYSAVENQISQFNEFCQMPVLNRFFRQIVENSNIHFIRSPQNTPDSHGS